MNPSNLQIRLIRNATLTITYNGVTLLVDPLFSKKAALDPVPWSNEIRNPTVELPFDDTRLQNIIDQTDAVVLTHLHRDHWDTEAQRRLPKSRLIVCQPEDVETLQQQGFTQLQSEHASVISNVFHLERVPAQHGHGELAQKMAPVSGFIIKAGEHTVYLAGDSVWYEGVEKTIVQYQPTIIIVNSGAAQFQFGEPITMTAEDVATVIRASAATTKVIAVHLEAINHCYLTRSQLKARLTEWDVAANCLIPADGEILNF